jgi:hypothetical protein
MFEIKPETMQKGQITSISITNNGTTEVLEILPIPFEIFNNENVKKVISKYYLKKQVCTNLIQQLAMAESEFSEAKKDFDLLVHLPEIHEELPKPVASIPVVDAGVEKAHKNFVKEHQLPQPLLYEHIPQPIPELYIESPKEEIKPPEPEAVKKIETIEEIAISIMNLEEFKALMINNNLTDASMNAIISNNLSHNSENTKEMVDTIRNVIITQLKEKGNIELSLSEKVKNVLKPRRTKTKQ